MAMQDTSWRDPTAPAPFLPLLSVPLLHRDTAPPPYSAKAASLSCHHRHCQDLTQEQKNFMAPVQCHWLLTAVVWNTAFIRLKYRQLNGCRPHLTMHYRPRCGCRVWKELGVSVPFAGTAAPSPWQGDSVVWCSEAWAVWSGSGRWSQRPGPLPCRLELVKQHSFAYS